MLALAFDLGREAAGAIGHLEEGAPRALFNLDSPAPVGACCSRLKSAASEHLMAAMNRGERVVLAWEKPYIPRGSAGGSFDVSARLLGMHGVLAMLGHEWGCYAKAFNVATIRAQVVGNGRAKDPEIMRFCMDRGLTPETSHQADAALVWFMAQRELTS